MKPWMLPWLLPLALLGTVAFVAEFNGYSALIAPPAALVALLWYLRLHPHADEGSDSDTHYWRIKRL
jgi:hypothetical protein